MRAPRLETLAWLCAALGLAAFGWSLASLWPDGGVRPWPAGTLALLALAAGCARGDVRPRALGTLCASAAAMLCTAEFAGLWLLAEVIP